MTEALPIFSAIIGILAGAVGTWLAIRKDARDARTQVIAEAKETIDLLKDQNEILRQQVEAAEARDRARSTANEAREREWEKREERLETRILELEREYRNLVKAVASMGLCKDPDNCVLKTITPTS